MLSIIEYFIMGGALRANTQQICHIAEHVCVKVYGKLLEINTNK